MVSVVGELGATTWQGETVAWVIGIGSTAKFFAQNRIIAALAEVDRLDDDVAFFGGVHISPDLGADIVMAVFHEDIGRQSISMVLFD